MNYLRSAFLLVIACLQSPAWAQAEPLGRLFFTPQQRAALDRQRQTNPNFLANTIEEESSLTINGEVRRSNGRNTRWINGEAQWTSGALAPQVPVGDTFHPSTGERESLLGEGRIVVKPGGVRK